MKSSRHGLCSACLFIMLASFDLYAAIELDVSFTADPAEYTPGDSSTYTLTITNDGATNESSLSVATDFPAGATVSAVNCQAVGTGSSCNENIQDDELDVSNNSIAPGGGSISWEITVEFAADMDLATLNAETDITSSDAAQSSTASVASAINRVSDLSVTKTASGTSYTPGTSVTDQYTIIISNDGPSDAPGIVLTDAAPAGMSITDWDCSPNSDCPVNDGSGDIDQTVDLAVGDSLTYTLDVDFASDLQAAALENQAQLTLPADIADPDEDNNASLVALTRDARTELSLEFDAGQPSSYVPGTEDQAISFTIINNGPSDAFAASLPLDWTSAVEQADWSCTPALACDPATGTGNATLSIDLAANASVTVNATLDYDSGARADLSLEPEISVTDADATDDVAGNNEDSLTLTVDRRADIRVTKTAGIAEVGPGGTFTYDILVENLGPSDLGSDPDDPSTFEEVGLFLTDDFDDTLLDGDLDVCLDTGRPCWEVCAADNGITGDYDAANCPTAPVTGNQVVDDEPSDIQDLPIALAAGSSTTLRAFVRAGSGASGAIDNLASVRLSDLSNAEVTAFSSGGGEDSDAATVPVLFISDITVSKTDDVNTAIAGEPHSYTIVVENTGFVSASNVQVADPFPLYDEGAFSDQLDAFPDAFDNAGFIPGSVSWQCRSFDGACCNNNSSNCGAIEPTDTIFADMLNGAVDLPGQSRVEYTISGLLDPRASGTLTNTATIMPQPELQDPDLDNNVSADTTTMVPQAGLGLDKSLLSLTAVDDVAPFTLVYSIVIENNGPSFVTAADVSDPLSASVFDATRADAEWTCVVVNNPGNTACDSDSGSGPLATTVNLDPGGTVEFELTVMTSDTATGEVRNDASIVSAAGTATDFVVTSLIGKAKLSVQKTDNRSEIAPGDEVEYVIQIDNEGPDDAFGVRVVDDFPDIIDGLTWSCEATTPIPGDLAFRQLSGAVDTAGNALVASADGRHVYVIGTTADSLFAYARNNTPGFNFGDVVLLETEINGINDGGDSGPVVTGLNNPIDIAMSPDGLNVYVLANDTDDGPALSAFSRSTNPAAPDFGELTFLGSVVAGLPLQPTALTLNNDNIYVAGSGDADAVDGNGDPVDDDDSPLVSIFDRDGLTGVPIHDFSQLGDVPAGIDSVVIDQAENLLFAGGERLVMFNVLPAQAGDPAGRLGFHSDLPVGDGITGMTLASDAAHLYGKSSAAGTARLVMIEYLNDDGDPLLQQRFVNTAAEMTLPPAIGDPLAGLGGIAVAADGEHLAGVSQDEGVLYTFARDIVSGGLTFAEAFAFDQPNSGDNRGLELATDVVFAPDGRHVLVASGAETEASNPPVAVYSRRAPEPLFAFIERDKNAEFDNIGLQAPNEVAISPDGAHVYAVSLPDNALVRFNRFPRLGLDDASMGMHLQFADAWFDGVDDVQGLVSPRRIIVSPDGKNVYVTSEEADTITVFERVNDADAADFGDLNYRQTLTQGEGDVDGIAGAQGMAMQSLPGTPHLYVAGSFGSSIARFDRDPDDGTLTFATAVFGGTAGVSGLSGIRDLAISNDGKQLLGVSTLSNALVVFNRQSNPSPEPDEPAFGELTFVQAQVQSIGVRPVAVAISGDGDHVYVAGQNSNSLAVLRRVTNPTSSAFGQVQPLDLLSNGEEGVEFMTGPRDVIVSPDGKRIYVAAEFSSAVLVFDRDLNPAGARYGLASLVETRRDTVNGVDGIRSARALTISNDSRNVYVAGFGDAAVASFRLGIGSVCAAGGSGNIDDRADIGARGTIVYRARGTLRPDALGEMNNTASATLPPTFEELDPQSDCPLDTDYCASDNTTLVPAGQISISKQSDQVSVTAGETANYTVTINNAGPSSLINEPGFPLTVSDLLDANPAFVPGSATWTCSASGSGNLAFNQAWRDFDPEDNTSGPFVGLAGVTGVDLVPGTTGPWLATASVVDNSVSVFARDPVTGDLIGQTRVSSGDILSGQPLQLDGAQSVQASHDGRFLYVASRVSDSVTVLSLTETAGGEPELGLVQTVTGLTGLNQAVDLILSPDATQQHLYVAGANDNAIAVFARNDSSGMLTWDPSIQSVQQGVGAVSGLIDVSGLLLSPDGLHLYALSPTSASITLFTRDTASGELNWQRTYDELDFAVGMQGAASAVFDQNGQYLYLSALIDNRILVLQRDSNPASGELSLASVVEQGVAGANGLVGAGELAITADNVHLYVTSESASTIAWYIRDAANGSLEFAGLRGNQTGLGGATGLVIDDTLQQLLIAGTGDAAISQYQRQADSFCPASGSGELVDVPFNIGAGGTVEFVIEVEVAGNASGVIENVAVVNAARDSINPAQSSTESSVVAAEADLVISKDDGLSEIDGLAGAAAIAGSNEYIYTAAPADNALGVFQRNVSPGNPNHGQLEFVQFLRAGVDGVEGLNGTLDVALAADGGQVYAVSPVDNSISSFARDADSGRLSFFDFQQNGVFGVTGISGANALTISPDDAHVYVTGGFANAIATFAREDDPLATDYGSLDFLELDQAGVNGVAGIGEPLAVAVAPDGRHVYVLGAEDDTLAVFSRNRTATSANFGALTFVEHYTNNIDGVAGLGGVRDIAISADGLFVYVLGDATGTLAQFSRDEVSGELAFVEFKQDGTAGTTGLSGARSMLLDDAGESLYVAAAAAAAIVRFSVDPTTGSLDFAELIENGDAAPLTGGEVFGLEGVAALNLTADGDHVYAASAGRDALLAFHRADDSVLLDFQQILIDGLGGVAPGVAVEYIIGVENLGPSDVNEARVVDLFPVDFESVQWTCSAVGGTGAACLDSGSGDLDEIVSLPAGGRLTISATGVVSAGATGRLINTASVSAEGVSDPDLSNNSATDDDTVLSPAADLRVSVANGMDDATPGDDVAWDVVVENDGPSSVRGVFVDDDFPAAVYRSEWSCVAEPAAGILAQPLLTDSRATPAALAISADGRFAYSAGGNEVEVFRRDPLTGALNQVQRLVAGSDGISDILGAADITISADGRFVYVAGAVSDAVVLFTRDSSSGELEFVDAWRDGLEGIEGLGGVGRLLLSPDGNFLYAAGLLDNALVTFAIDDNTGALQQQDLLSQGIDDVDGLNGPRDMAWSADEEFLLLVAETNQSLLALTRNAATGELTPVSILLNDDLMGGSAENALLGATAVIAIEDETSENEILVAARDSQLIGRFRLDLADPEVPEDQPELLAVGVIAAADLDTSLASPFDLQFDPDQARLYAATTDGVLLISLLGEMPALIASYTTTEVPPFPSLNGLAGIVLSPGLKQLYTLSAQADAEIAAWSRERGSRCPLQGSGRLGRQQVDIVAGGRLLYSIGGGIQANATGDLSYSVSVDNPVAGQEINPADNTATDTDPLVPRPDLGVSKLVNTVPVVAGLPIDWRIDFTNAGLSDAVPGQLDDMLPVFPLDAGGIVAESGVWSCAANVPLSAAINFATPAELSNLAVGPQGRYVYATSATANALLVFALQADDSLSAPVVIADGDAVVGSEDDDDVVSGLGGAVDVAVSADGLSVYVAGASSDSVVVFTRSDLDAELQYRQTFTTTVPPEPGTVAGLRGASAVNVTPDQRHVLVAGKESNAIAVLARDADTGELEYIERVVDGIGTIVPEFNVIRGVNSLHTVNVGGDVYAIAEDSEAITRFTLNADSGMLTFAAVWRQGDGGLPALTGLRAMTAAPGDTHLYLLVDAGIVVLRRTADGNLVFAGLFDEFPDLASSIALAVDGSGSRAYVLSQTGSTVLIHILRRDWANGELEFWFSQAVTGAAPTALVQTAASRQIYLAAAADALQRFDEQALSRCRTSNALADSIDADVDLGASGWSAFDVAAVVHPSARGEISNTVAVQPALGEDPDLLNNSATATAEIEVVSDLSVSKTGPVEAIAGTMIEYQISVGNAGPSDALGIMVTDVVPVPLSQISWTCSASEGSICPANGTGAPDFAATVLVNGSLDISLQGMIDAAFIGTITNIVQLTPEPDASDPTPLDQRAEWSTNVVARADVAVTKTTLNTPLVAGLPASYVLTASNNGPSDATAVRLTDLFAAELLYPAWSCSASAGANCPANGFDNIDVTIAMPVASSVEFTVTADLSSAAQGTLGNAFSAAVQLPAEDPDGSNNLAEVQDLVAVRPDLELDLSTRFNPFDPAGPIDLPLLASITNAGPSLARAVALLIDFSAPVTVTANGCSQPNPSQVSCLLPQLDAGASQTVEFVLSDLPPAPDSVTIDGIVTTSGDDPDVANNNDVVLLQLETGIDIAASVDNGRVWLAPDMQLEYEIEFANYGSQNATSVNIDVVNPPELLDVSWTCQADPGAACTGSGSGTIADAVVLDRAASVRYLLQGRVDPTLDLTVPQAVSLIAVASNVVPNAEINAVNNTAVDIDQILQVLTKNGFESALRQPAQVFQADAGCTEVALAASAMRAIDPGRVMIGHSASNEPLLWLDYARRGDSRWLRLVAIGRDGIIDSDWQSPHAAGASLIIVNRKISLTGLAAGDWHADQPLLAVPATLTRVEHSSTAAAELPSTTDIVAVGCSAVTQTEITETQE